MQAADFGRPASYSVKPLWPYPQLLQASQLQLTSSQLPVGQLIWCLQLKTELGPRLFCFVFFLAATLLYKFLYSQMQGGGRRGGARQIYHFRAPGHQTKPSCQFNRLLGCFAQNRSSLDTQSNFSERSPWLRLVFPFPVFLSFFRFLCAGCSERFFFLKLQVRPYVCA